MLWVNDLLLPSFVFYLLYVLLDRRLHPYPSLAQLREHRGHIDKASEFGEELQARLTSTTPFGVFDAWKTLKVYNKSKIHKTKDKTSVTGDGDAVTESDIATTDDSAENPQEQDLKALGLEGLRELADGLERLKKCVE